MNVPTPVVIGAMTDPVGSGVATSLARPGGNITGLSLATGDDFGVKYLELLSELRPGLRRVAVLYYLPRPAELKAMQLEAPRFGIDLVSIHVGSKAELAESFERIASRHADAAVVITDPFTFAERHRIIALASASRLPVIYGLAAFVDAGGLLAYGPSLRERWHRAAFYVDRILKGAKPADLPIEQPTRFELVINAKTARAWTHDSRDAANARGPRRGLARIQRLPTSRCGRAHPPTQGISNVGFAACNPAAWTAAWGLNADGWQLKTRV
jgi:putative ABC transport system substrate-binding protein